MSGTVGFQPTVMPFEDRMTYLDSSLFPHDAVVFTNARLCISGQLTQPNSVLVASQSTGKILEVLYEKPTRILDNGRANVIDLGNKILAPGFLELQTNGMRGFHFTHFENEWQYVTGLQTVANYLPSQGVTGFWVTIPTVEADEFKKILPVLYPRNPKHFENRASLLGAHAEGPYLHPSKKGAHNASLFYEPSAAPLSATYGDIANDNRTLKLVTLAPETQGACALTSALVERGIRVSLGHSNASYSDGLEAVKAGASCLTHTLNAMAPLHHRDPGLAGLATAAPAPTHTSPYFSVIADGHHLHPSVVTMLFRANPAKCILITDSIELAGLPDGTYPGHSQIQSQQTKKGTRVVIEGTETLIGSCISLRECISNLMQWSGCGIAQAVRCVTENIADFMGENERGKLEVGRLADLVVLDDSQGLEVVHTWLWGCRVWARNQYAT